MAVLASISLGLLFNFYPDHWMFFIVTLVIFLMLSAVMRRSIPYKQYIGIILGALVIGSPYIISSLGSRQACRCIGHSARIGLIHTHFPSGIENVGLSLIVLVVFFWFVYKKIVPVSKWKWGLFLLSGVAGAIVVVNQHVITGIIVLLRVIIEPCKNGRI